MINCYKTIDRHICEIDKHEDGCWINCIEPKEEEIDMLVKEFNIDTDFFRSALDEEESSHIDDEDGNCLIIVNVPRVEKRENNLAYDTVPLGIIITQANVITVCMHDNPLLSEFADDVIKDVEISFKVQFVLKIMLRMAAKYLQYLKQIDKISNNVESGLRKSMKNKELIQLLEIQKSLVYFSSSLKSNEVTISRIRRGRHIKLYEEDHDLIEDVSIEINQAIEMSNIYLNIMSGTMDAFASVISNNLNIVMKVLASITLIISIPTVISGLYGMNVEGLPVAHLWYFPLVISLVLMAIAALILRRTKML
jgi:magnesium transporter